MESPVKPGNLSAETDLLIDQIRTVSNQRFVGTAPIAVLGPNHTQRVAEALAILTL
jgi:mRNA interferase MazF